MMYIKLYTCRYIQFVKYSHFILCQGDHIKAICAAIMKPPIKEDEYGYYISTHILSDAM